MPKNNARLNVTLPQSLKDAVHLSVPRKKLISKWVRTAIKEKLDKDNKR